MKYLLWAALLLLPAIVVGQSKPPQAPAVIEELDERGNKTIIVTKPRNELGVTIGEQLFNDPILSANGSVSCATCHPKDHSFASKGLPPSLAGGTLTRKAPSLLNRGTGKSFFWDGRANSLEEQAAGPLTNPLEMGQQSIADVLNRIKTKYPSIQNERDLTKAIATYERTLVSPVLRLDSYIKGEEDHGMSVAEIRGWNLFRGKAECYLCHDPKNNFTDEKFHNTGVGIGQREDGSQYTFDRGRYEITKSRDDMCAYKTPGLKGCKDAGPYMHNSSIPTLEGVVEFYVNGGFPNRNLDKNIKRLNLNRQEQADLVTFLKSL